MKKLCVSSFRERLESVFPHYQNQSFLLAVSGGADSMVLLHLCKQLEMDIHVAHVNYHLRGDSSNADEVLVKEICQQYNVPCYVYDVIEQEKKGNTQLWARELRYQFFEEIQMKYGISALMTAHHLNDSAETFFINLLRGTGIRGLCGIPERENRLVRPLLSFGKKEIYDYATENNVLFREDESNAENFYTRNRIRHEVIEKLEEISPDFLDNFYKSIGFLKEAKNLVESIAKEHFERISTQKNNTVSIVKRELQALPDILKYEILSLFGFTHRTEIEKLFTAATGSIFYYENYRILINRDEILISSDELMHQERICIPETEDWVYDIRDYIGKEKWETRGEVWLFDREKLQFPLEIRPKQEGDFFYPKGMKGKKKVSKYLKDEKISQFDKEKCKILCDASGEILGVIPYRQDGRRVCNDFGSISKVKILF